MRRSTAKTKLITPKIALATLIRADIPVGDRVLDPSAGSGNLLDAIRVYTKDRDHCNPTLDAFEIDEINTKSLFLKGYNFTQVDFLDVTPDPTYSLVYINPPYQGDAWKKHINHAVKFLQPLGHMIAIVPAKWFTPGAFMDSLIPGLKSSWILPKSDKGSPINTAVIVYKKPRDSYDDSMKPICGYPSFYCYDIMIHLENEEDFCNLPDESKIKQLDHWVTKISKERSQTFLWTQEIKNQVIESIIEYVDIEH